MKVKFFLFFVIIFTYQIKVICQDSAIITKELSVDSIPTPDFNTSTTIFQKITQDSFFEVILETNFDSLLKNKKISKKKYAGIIKFKNTKGQSLKIKVKIEPRGRFRRKICDMPPLKIDFPKKGLAKLGLFPGCDKLKLVTHCNDTEGSDQVLMKEYWSYKLYSELTPNSFRVFPVKITYLNTNNRSEKMERFAFFLENNEELAFRLDGDLNASYGTKVEQLEKESYHNTLMFQYMIGNVDWDILVQRNIKLIKPKNDSLFILIPYDFDYAGLVYAPYARLNPDLNQKNIEERFCLGSFSNKKDLLKTASLFLSTKEKGFKCYKECPVLSKFYKKKMNKYLNSFYKILKDEKKLVEIFLSKEVIGSY